MTIIDLSLTPSGSSAPFERVVSVFNQIPRTTLVPSLGNPPHNPLLAAHQFGMGICDDYSRVFVSLMRSMGAQAWVRSLNGHVGAEIIIDGRKIYIDPLQGFWIEKAGEILTADQIMATPAATVIQFRSFRTGLVTSAPLSSEPLMALIGTDDWSGEEFTITETPDVLSIPAYEAHSLEPLSSVPAYFNSIAAGQQTTDAATFRTLVRAANIRAALSTPSATRVNSHNLVSPSPTDATAIEFKGSNSQVAYEIDPTLIVNKINVSFDASSAASGNSVIIRLTDRLGKIASDIGPISANTSYSYAFYPKDLISQTPTLLDGCVVWFIVLHNSSSKVSPIKNLTVTYRSQVTPLFRARYEAATAPL